MGIRAAALQPKAATYGLDLGVDGVTARRGTVRIGDRHGGANRIRGL